jgi:hypothetical protein
VTRHINGRQPMAGRTVVAAHILEAGEIGARSVARP